MFLRLNCIQFSIFYLFVALVFAATKSWGASIDCSPNNTSNCTFGTVKLELSWVTDTPTLGLFRLQAFPVFSGNKTGNNEFGDPLYEEMEPLFNSDIKLDAAQTFKSPNEYWAVTISSLFLDYETALFKQQEISIQGVMQHITAPHPPGDSPTGQKMTSKVMRIYLPSASRSASQTEDGIKRPGIYTHTAHYDSFLYDLTGFAITNPGGFQNSTDGYYFSSFVAEFEGKHTLKLYEPSTAFLFVIGLLGFIRGRNTVSFR